MERQKEVEVENGHKKTPDARSNGPLHEEELWGFFNTSRKFPAMTDFTGSSKV